MLSRPMKRMLIIMSVVFGLIIGWYSVKKILFWYFMSHYQMPAVTISAVEAKTKTWQSYLTAVGTLSAVNGVDISAEVPGIVKEIHFQSGQSVKQGDILVRLDTQVEIAQLKNNVAQAKLAKLNYDRNKALIANHAVSQAELDRLSSLLQEAEANVEQSQAKIQQKTIMAPFSGKIGIRQIDIGQYVSAGTVMVTLQALDPLYVQFNLPEQYLTELYLQQPVKVTVNLAGGKSVMGTITAINSKVDQATRNILIQATIPNPDYLFYPGMFASVDIMLRKQLNVITLPETAISYSLHGDSVFIIQEEKPKGKDKPLLKTYRRYVTIGEHRGNEVAVEKGIKAGEKVVTSGQLKLQNGADVVIDNSVELS